MAARVPRPGGGSGGLRPCRTDELVPHGDATPLCSPHSPLSLEKGKELMEDVTHLLKVPTSVITDTE